MLKKLKDLDDLVCETGEILRGDVVVYEGKVRWVERLVQHGKYDDDIDLECGYEFLEINSDNIDMDNIPKYLREYIEHQLLMEELTVKIIDETGDY